jgi:hypothetical protein
MDGARHEDDPVYAGGLQEFGRIARILERVIGLIVDPSRLDIEAALQGCPHRSRFDVKARHEHGERRPVRHVRAVLEPLEQTRFGGRSPVLWRVLSLSAAAENHDCLGTARRREVESGIAFDDRGQRTRDQRQRQQRQRAYAKAQAITRQDRSAPQHGETEPRNEQRSRGWQHEHSQQRLEMQQEHDDRQPPSRSEVVIVFETEIESPGQAPIEDLDVE